MRTRTFRIRSIRRPTCRDLRHAGDDTPKRQPETLRGSACERLGPAVRSGAQRWGVRSRAETVPGGRGDDSAVGAEQPPEVGRGAALRTQPGREDRTAEAVE